MKSAIIRGAQKGAEKVLMANVLVGTGIISIVEKVQEISYDNAVKLRSNRMEISQEQAADELKAQHDEVVAKAKSTAERVKGILSKKSVLVQSN